jgi:hypothetical protein
VDVERWDVADPKRCKLSKIIRIVVARFASDACAIYPAPYHCIARDRTGLCSIVPRGRRASRAPTNEVKAMKTFASPSFFRTFDLLMDAANPGTKLMQWSYDGVEWVRDRYSVTGRNHAFAIEIISLTRPGRHGWGLIVTREHWWAGAGADAIRTGRWARPVSGRRKDIIEWFRKQQAEIERGSQRVRRGSAPAGTTIQPS